MSSVTSDAVYKALFEDLQVELARSVVCEGDRELEITRFACYALRDGFLSKLIPKDTSKLDRVAYNTFIRSNDRCKAFNATHIVNSFPTAGDETAYGEFRKILEDFFLSDLGSDCSLTWSNIALNARCGPGAAVMASGTSHYSKMYSGPLSATSSQLLHLHAADIAMWPEESNAEIIRQENFGSPTIVEGSRSCFVPKSVKTSRMISVEPTLNMYYQLGLGEILRIRLLRFFGIDLETQPSTNRWMACLGSRIDASFGDGFATIDLSSASDSISLGLCGEIIPEDWLSAMISLRSPSTSIKLSPTSKVIEDSGDIDVQLNMISTMGNGFTFPLQTAIFAAMASACISVSDGVRFHPRACNPGNLAGQFSVFGDDIVIRARESTRLLRLLRSCGFEPNLDKTFHSGDFRESCGHDYYRGFNVRPVFLRKMDSETDLVVLVNLLADWGTRNGVNLSKTLGLLLSGVRQVNIVPMSETEDAGVKVPYSVAMNRRDLRGGQHPHYQSLVYTKRYAHSKRMRISDGEIHTPPGTRRQIYNPSGLLMSYLRGEIRNGSITLSVNKPLYRTKRAIAPNWDYRVTTLEDRLIGRDLSPTEYTTRYAMLIGGALANAKVSSRKRRVSP
jgi:hypothetical protein